MPGAFLEQGRATVTVHHERYDRGTQYERYVVAEGPVRFENTPPDDDADPFLTAVLEPESVIGVIYG